MSLTDRIDGYQSGLAFKAPCRVATTANITLSATQTVDGVALAEYDRVLVKDQTTTTENGIYTVQSGAWQRARDFDGARDVVQGTVVAIAAGTTNADTYWRVTTANPIVFGTSAITFAISNSELAGVTPFAQTLLDDLTAAAFLATLGVSDFIQTLLNDADAAAALATLGALATDGSGATLTGVLKPGTTDNLTVGFTSDVYAVGSLDALTSDTYTVSLVLEPMQTLTIDASGTLAPPASGNGVAVILATTDGTGGYTLTTSGFTKVNGAFNAAASKVHRFTVTKIGSTTILDIDLVA